MSHTHSPRAIRFAETFENISVAEMIEVQRVYIGDFERLRAEGNEATAQRILDRNINPLGEAIDMRDGTCRECAEIATRS